MNFFSDRIFFETDEYERAESPLLNNTKVIDLKKIHGKFMTVLGPCIFKSNISTFYKRENR